MNKTNKTKFLLIFLALFVPLCLILTNIYNYKNNTNTNEYFYSEINDINELKKTVEDNNNNINVLKQKIDDSNNNNNNIISGLNQTIEKFKKQLEESDVTILKQRLDELKTKVDEVEKKGKETEKKVMRFYSA